MARLVLYGVAISAFVAKVRITLDLKGFEYEELPPPDGYGSAAYRAIVPAGSVPGLLHGSAALSDSNAICEYLDALAPDPPLRADGALERARMRAFLGYHDTRLEASARALYPLVKRDWRAEPEAVAAGFDGVRGAVARLGEMAAPGPFLMGARLTLADLAYPVTFGIIDALAAEMGEAVALPVHLAEWRARVAAVPEVARSVALSGEAMEGWLAGFRAG